LDRNGDDLALIKAALDSTAIVINGNPFTQENPIRSEDLADLLNASLNVAGNTARFAFDDGSVLQVSIVFKSGKKSGQVWVEAGLLL